MKVNLFWPLTVKRDRKNNIIKYDCCISISYFAMKYGTYRKTTTYTGQFIKWSKHIPKNCFIRMYIDKSVFTDPEFSDILKLDIPLEIYMFEDKRFLLEDGIHHDGTFGTMARFLPLFDDTLDVDYIWIADMDMEKFDFDEHYLEDMIKQKAYVSFHSEACYARYWIPKETNYPIVNDRIIVSKKIKFSKYQFDKFLREINEGKFKELKGNIEKVRKRLALLKIEKFTYGFDEYYTNNILNKQFIKNNQLIYYSLTLKQVGIQNPGIISNFEEIDKLEYSLYKDFNPNTNLKLKIASEKSRQDIEKNKEMIKDSYRFKKCVKDFDEFKDNLDLREKFTAVIFVPAE
jgi:hypothetical protein